MRTYFAYGSNMCVEQMARRCPNARLIGPAVLENYRFQIVRAGYASIVPRPRQHTSGILWRITVGNRRRLDAYEQIEHALYRLLHVPVRRADGSPCIALTYIATDLKPGRPRPGYIEVIVRAAQRLGFPPAAIADLACWDPSHRLHADQCP